MIYLICTSSSFRELDHDREMGPAKYNMPLARGVCCGRLRSALQSLSLYLTEIKFKVSLFRFKLR